MNNPDNDRSLNLSTEEQEALDHDRQLMDALKKANAGSSPLEPILDSAISAGEIEYWSALGNIAQVKSALQNGGDANEIGEGGYTALHAAAENGHVSIAELLVNNGADLTATLDSGETAYDLAQLAEQHDVAIYLNAANG